MSFLCDKGYHKWGKGPHGRGGCTCARCGRTIGLDSPSDMDRHDWNGCKCRVCGLVRGVWTVVGPDWKDEWHDWNGCTCTICGTVRNVLEDGHRFAGGKCEICGQTLNKHDLLALVTRDPKEWEHSSESIRLPQLALQRAFEGLSPEDADDVLVACYAAAVERGPHVFGKYDCPASLGRYVKQSNVARLFLADTRGAFEFYPSLPNGSHLDCDEVIKMVKQAPDCDGWNDDARRKLLIAWKASDGELVTDCDLGNHKWAYVGCEDEYVGEHYYKTSTWRCTRCGQEKHETTAERL